MDVSDINDISDFIDIKDINDWIANIDMTVKTLRLQNFRNYGLQHIEFSKNLNILYGDNAQGKTNLLEAIFLCSTGRSHRALKDTDMIKFGEAVAIVTLELERKNYGDVTIEVEIQSTSHKSILINGVPQQRAGDILGHLNCAMFSPEDLTIVKDEPALRRRFIDMFISQIKPAYYYNLQRYQSIMRQRNALLRQAKETPRILDTLEAWDRQLAEFGAKVMIERRQYSKRLNEYAKKNHTMITRGREEFSMIYNPSMTILGGTNISIADQYFYTLEKGRQLDVLRMTTSTGPHKDDLECIIDNRSLRYFGSQGQQRTAALALKMAQVDVMADEIGEMPVMLLDDVMSELDRRRQVNLSSHIKDLQIFISGAERYTSAIDGNDSDNMNARYYCIEKGQIYQE